LRSTGCIPITFIVIRIQTHLKRVDIFLTKIGQAGVKKNPKNPEYVEQTRPFLELTFWAKKISILKENFIHMLIYLKEFIFIAL
jgi:hypothetical protein